MEPRAMTLRFTSDVWGLVEREAARRGIDPEAFIRDAVLLRLGVLAARREAADGRPPDPAAAVNDPERLRAVAATGRRRDVPPDERLDYLTEVAARAAGSPMALITLIDQEGQFFVGAHGLDEPLDTHRYTPLSHSFCQHVVARGAPVVVPDAREDAVLHSNPAIADLGAIAYLGVPVESSDGCLLGSFCVIDKKPREWTEKHVETLTVLAASASAEIDRASPGR